jgi:acetyltransferase-like isoleucine patch superfamily enzyme
VKSYKSCCYEHKEIHLNGISNLYPAFLRRFYGMHIGANVRISYKAKLDKSINPKGIHIGDNTWVLADSMVLAHDYCRGENGKGKNTQLL